MWTSKLRGNFVSILVGGMGMLILLLLTGAGLQPSVGKYQMEVISRDRATHIYVMDTTTGVVKWVDKMNTPFEKMKGD
jgi:hypothetical protein